MRKDIFEGFGLDGEAGRKIGKAMMELAEIETKFLNKLLNLDSELPGKNPIQNPFEEE